MPSIIKVDQIQSDTGNVRVTGNLSFGTSNVLTIGQSSGRIGVNNASPEEVFHAKGSADSYLKMESSGFQSGIKFETTGSVAEYGILADTTGTSYPVQTLRFYDFANGNDIARAFRGAINGDGNPRWRFCTQVSPSISWGSTTGGVANTGAYLFDYEPTRATWGSTLAANNAANNITHSLVVRTPVLDNTDTDAIVLMETGGQATGRQGITWINADSGNYRKARITTQVGNGYLETNFFIQVADGSKNLQTRLSINQNGAVTIPGSLSKGSGSFRIPHPLPAKANTHELVHSFIEGPQADLIYRGKATLSNGTATVNIDTAAGMTDGTFVALCRDVQCFTSNETDWDAVKGSVNGNILTISCQNTNSTATISWLVIGERKDKHMYDTSWTDDEGKVIVEPEIPVVNTSMSMT